jgi:putative flippase GtrA
MSLNELLHKTHLRGIADFFVKLCKVKIIRYFLIGSIGASIDLVIFSTAILYFRLPWFAASLASLIISTLAGYFLSIRFVFQSGIRFKMHQEIFGVLVISAIAFVMHQALMYMLIEILSIQIILSKILVIGLMFLFNYFCRSRIIFKN